MKELWKSVNVWWSYGQQFGVLFLLSHSVELCSARLRLEPRSESLDSVERWGAFVSSYPSVSFRSRSQCLLYRFISLSDISDSGFLSQQMIRSSWIKARLSLRRRDEFRLTIPDPCIPSIRFFTESRKIYCFIAALEQPLPCSFCRRLKPKGKANRMERLRSTAGRYRGFPSTTRNG